LLKLKLSELHFKLSSLLRHIPNFITLLNLSTGIAGIWFVLESNPFKGALLVFLAALFDFLDGMSARMLNSFSVIGKSLDSLADMVSFGVLPGIMVFKLQSVVLGTGTDFQWNSNMLTFGKILLIFPLLIPALSAIRLARFDNDERQLTEFRGLPTPANAMFIAAWLASYPALHKEFSWLYNPWMVTVISLVLAFLMITDIRMFSIKFRDFQLKSNLLRYLFLGASALILIMLQIPGVMVIIILYVCISVVWNQVPAGRIK